MLRFHAFLIDESRYHSQICHGSLTKTFNIKTNILCYFMFVSPESASARKRVLERTVTHATCNLRKGPRQTMPKENVEFRNKRSHKLQKSMLRMHKSQQRYALQPRNVQSLQQCRHTDIKRTTHELQHSAVSQSCT